MRTEWLLAEIMARHPIAILLCATILLLALAGIFNRLVMAYAPHAWRIGAAAWQAVGTTALAKRLARTPALRPAVTRTLSAAQFLGLYAPIAFLVAGSAAAAFIELVDEIGAGESLEEFDRALSSKLREHLSLDTLRIFAWITMLGDPAFLVALAGLVTLVLLWRRKWLLAGAWVVATASGALLNRLLKALFERERPTFDHGLVTAPGWSFPSGHASGSMLVYAMLGYYIVRHVPQVLHLPVALVSAAAIVFAGSSRIFLHVHYVSDVLAGYAVGASWAALCVGGLEIVRSHEGRRREVGPRS